MNRLMHVRRAALVLPLVFAGICWAAPPPALIVTDGNVADFEETNIVGNLTTALTTAGYTVSTNVGVPSTVFLAGFKQVWDMRYHDVSLSPTDITSYVGYLAGGGALFVVGENTGFAPNRDASIASFVLSAGGGTITPVPSNNVETVLPPFTTTPDAVTSITYLIAAGSVSTGTGAFITIDSNSDGVGSAIVWRPGTLANALPGTLITVFDADFMQTSADANSHALLANLIGFLNAPPPFITNLNPTSGPVNTSVTITGVNFGATQGGSTVTFNGTTAGMVTAWSANSITVNVPAGATTGNVVVTVGGVASNGVAFTVTTPPSITSLNPTSGPVGTSVVIAGLNFGATQGGSTVTFNGTSAGTATTWSATSITINVPAGATTGNVVVTVGGLASNGVTFTVTVAPFITSLNPVAGPVGTSVTIAGGNFGATQGGSTVTFNGTSAGTATTWSATSITINVPAGATTGNVVVTVGGLASNGVTFTVTVAPFISSLNPVSGPVNTSVTIAGGNFGATQGGSTVTFNGTATGTATNWTPTSITVNVPPGATTGNVVVTVGGLASNGVAFTVTAGPSITSLNPNSGPVGTSVTITGLNFGATQGGSTVTFNGTTAAVTSWTATSITVTVPAGATTGNAVVTVGGVASNGVAFTVTTTPTVPALSDSAMIVLACGLIAIAARRLQRSGQPSAT